MKIFSLLTLLALGAARHAAAGTLPRPAHVVVIIEENRTLAQIIQGRSASYLRSLAARGALFTDAHGVTHPSQPNYTALFAGLLDTNGDACPAAGIDPRAPNLGSELFAAHRSFAGYSEGLPAPGSTVCWAGPYARKHNPWVDFTNVPAASNLPLSAFPAYPKLPTVAMVVPNVDDDMHDGTVQAADEWARAHVEPLVRWAYSHDTLVVFTWDEGYDSTNSIPTFFVGPMVRPGRYRQRIDHYDVLRTIERMYGLQPTGAARKAKTISAIWR